MCVGITVFIHMVIDCMLRLVSVGLASSSHSNL